MTTRKAPLPRAGGHKEAHKAGHTMRRPWAVWVVAAILIFIGIGAVPAGYAMIADPSGETLGMAGQLDGSLFPSFLIPGLYLFFVNGVGSIVSAVLLLLRPNWQWAQRLNPVRSMQWQWQWLLALLFGVNMMLWILVQVLNVRDSSWMQPFYFGLGAAVVALLLLPSVRHDYALAAKRR